MLTTSPACSARHISKSMVRDSNRTVSPSLEISPVAEFTRQAPTRRIGFAGAFMQDHLLTDKTAGADFINTRALAREHIRRPNNTASRTVAGRGADLIRVK